MDGARPVKILDLFCGAGGASMGLHNACPDAEIIGVDLHRQPRYPFTFVQADALEYPLEGFDFIWASPPCQKHTAGAKRWKTTENHPHLIPPIRERLLAAGTPYVIENVMGALEFLRQPIMLCGTFFGLGVFRHRLFETNFPVKEPTHEPHLGRVGDGTYHTVTGHAGGSSKRDGWKGGSVDDWRFAMKIGWMTGDELAESIPPAFSEYILNQWLLGRP